MKKYTTEISESNFRKLNLIGYKREWITLEDGTKRLGWKKVILNDEIDDVKKDWDEYFKGSPRTIVIAIHNDWELAEEYEKIWNESDPKDIRTRANLPDGFYYWDKFLNKLGATTYQLGCGISKLYSRETKWYITEDYFDINKKETQDVFFIHLDE